MKPYRRTGAVHPQSRIPTPRHQAVVEILQGFSRIMALATHLTMQTSHMRTCTWHKTVEKTMFLGSRNEYSWETPSRGRSCKRGYSPLLWHDCLRRRYDMVPTCKWPGKNPYPASWWVSRGIFLDIVACTQVLIACRTAYSNSSALHGQGKLNIKKNNFLSRRVRLSPGCLDVICLISLPVLTEHTEVSAQNDGSVDKLLRSGPAPSKRTHDTPAEGSGVASVSTPGTPAPPYIATIASLTAESMAAHV